jgi:hypothetical protein
MARERLAAWSRSLAALVGTLPPALLAGVVVAVHAPLGRDLRFALGYGLTLPAWVAAMCLMFLVRRPLHAWLSCLLATALLLLLAACGPPSIGVVGTCRAHRQRIFRPAVQEQAAGAACNAPAGGQCTYGTCRIIT